MSNARIRQLLFELGIKPEAGGDTPVYIFSSAKLHHVWIALQHNLWAVADIDFEQMSGRATKAAQMPVGANGLFYCSDAKCFTVPFRIESKPANKEVRDDPWPGSWHFPFQIRPLGDLSKRIPLSKAKTTWKALQSGEHLNSVLRLAGGMAFVPSWLYESDWELVLRELSVPTHEAPGT